MWNLLRNLVRGIVVAVATGLIVLAVGAGLLRLAVIQLPSYQGEIQTWVRSELGIDLRFTRLDARWSLLGPEFRFENATLSRTGGEDDPIISSAEATITLSALTLFTDRRLEVNRLTLNGYRLGLERTADGALRLANQWEGLDSEIGFAPNDLPPVTVVLNNGSVAYADSIRQRTWEFDDVRLELVRDADSITVEARANAPQALAERLEVAAQLGPAGTGGFGETDWRLVGEVRGADLAAWRDLLPASLPLPAAGVGNVSFWLDFTGEEVRQATLQLALQGLRLDSSGSGDDPAYARADLTLEWSRLDAGWALSASNLDLSRDGRDWPSGAGVDLEVLEDAAGLASLSLRSEFLRLEDLSPLFAVLPASTATDLWAELEPRGDVRGVELSLARGGESWNYAAAANFDGLQVASRGQWPGLAGLSGELRMDSRSGRVDLLTRDATLLWPEVFSGPLDIDELSGRLTWRRGLTGLRALTDELVLNTPDGRIRSSLELNWPSGGGLPALALQSRVVDFDAGAARKYFPANVIPQVLAYLDRAIIGGRIVQADITLDGPLAALPFDGGAGEFRARVEVEDGSMAYVEDWPPAEELTGVVEFNNLGWEARGSGRVFGNRSENLRVAMEDVRDPVLAVTASTQGALDDTLRFLKAAPLIASHLGPDLQRLQSGGGTSEVTFNLALPLLRRTAYQLNAALQVTDGELAIDGFGPALSGIRGGLRLDNAGAVSGAGIQATFIDAPVAVRISTADEPGYLAQVDFDGEIEVGSLQAAFNLPFRENVSGRSRWAARLLLPENRFVQARREPLRIEVESDLAGVDARLPEPLGKLAEESTPLEIEFVFSEADRLNVNGQVGEDQRFALSFRNRDGELSFRRGGIRFGGALPLLPPRDGLSVGGELATVRFDDWWELFRRQVPEASAAGLLLGANLEIADFSAFGQPLGPADVSIRQQAARWHLEIASEPVAGLVTWPLNLGDRPQLLADMERLYINLEQMPTAVATDPRELPGVLLRATDFALGTRRFGEFDADIQADPEGLRMIAFAARSDTLSMEGSGGWFQREQGSETRLVLSASSGDAAGSLVQLGFDPITEAESAQVGLNVHWPSAPWAEWEGTVTGALNMRMQRGSVPNLDPGAGRMVGLMSIAALPRRLALDFRDVFNRGLVFDELSGDFVIIDGNAFTDNLHLTGPVVDIGVAGRTGLLARDYEQHAVVTSEPGRILPAVGLLAGPQVGAALLIFSEIFKEPLNGVGRASYCVTGDWDEPSVERLTPEQLEQNMLCADMPQLAEPAAP